MVGEVIHWNMGIEELALLRKKICLDIVIELFNLHD
jgi:hypothetical protein